jgi:formylglycine-generating enzyme
MVNAGRRGALVTRASLVAELGAGALIACGGTSYYFSASDAGVDGARAGSAGGGSSSGAGSGAGASSGASSGGTGSSSGASGGGTGSGSGGSSGSTGSSGGGSSGGAGSSSGGSSGNAGSSSSGSSDGGSGGGNGCPVVQAGPTMAPAGAAGFCIDSTEVTNAQYAAFLAATPSAAPPAACAFNQGYVPVAGWPYATGEGDVPVVSIDWCDAYAYCAWTGKRLCGRIGGGTNPPTALTDPTQSQWYAACSTAGALAYPYGAVYEQGVCYGAEPAGSPLIAVASYPGCVGGYPGIFDMSGSVWEWEDSCSAETGADDLCQIRGGSLNQGGTGLGCAVNTPVTRGSATDDRGFRCCDP